MSKYEVPITQNMSIIEAVKIALENGNEITTSFHWLSEKYRASVQFQMVTGKVNFESDYINKDPMTAVIKFCEHMGIDFENTEYVLQGNPEGIYKLIPVFEED